ncbi:hypothetical protein [Gordonia sp. (in: high G+C Gram-positive bacteria)]|uniref:hypothetical protein n=1 Tax=Gordonia sp. (in: high G+C Gram-positive bacteria) TaxID=84139 RepID=UPI003C75191A
MTYTQQATTSGTPRQRRTYFIAGAVALAVLLASMLIIRFGVEGTRPVDRPSGLTSTVEGTKVQLSWNGVSGADWYQVIRDKGTVVYVGSATTATDSTAPQGKRSYVIRAERNGVWSEPSAATEVTVDASWGVYQPFVDTVPKLLPKSPDGQGWEGAYCEWAIAPTTAEVGPEPMGSGKVRTRARINCNGSSAVYVVSWLVSADATDEFFKTKASDSGGDEIAWKHGTGIFDPKQNAAFLRTDLVKNSWIAVSVPGGTKQQMIETANKLPLE